MHEPAGWVQKHWIRCIFLSVWGGVFCLYLLGTARVPVGYGDSDELIGIGYLLGLPHPPGYPLMTFLTYGITHLIPWGTVVWRANILAVFCQSLTVAMVWLVSFRLLNMGRVRVRRGISELAAVVGALSLAFSYLYWLYAHILEVFPLNNLLAMTAVWMSLELVSPERQDNYFSKRGLKEWGIFFLVLGFLVFHHHSSWLVIPGLVIWLWPQFKHQKVSRDLSRLGLGIVIIGGVFLLNLGGAAWLNHQQAVWSWTSSSSLPALINYLFRGIYSGVSIETGSYLNAYLGQINLNQSIFTLKYYLSQTLPNHWGYPGLLFLLLGIWYSGKVLPRRIWFGLITIAALTGPALAGYLNLPVSQDSSVAFWQTLAITERMYLLGYVAYGLIIPFGLMAIYQFLYRRKLLITPALMVIAAGLYLGSLVLNNLPATDLSREAALFNTVKRAIESVPPGSTIICFSDISCFSLLSAQAVSAGRPDIYILPVTPQINSRQYLKAQGQVQKFSYPDNPFRITDSLSWTLYQGRHVYVTELPEFYLKLLGLDGQAYRLSPWALGYEVSCSEKPESVPDDSAHPFEQKKVLGRNTNKYLQGLVFNPKNIRDRIPDTPEFWVCPTSNSHYLEAMTCQKTGNRQCAYNELFWSMLKDPLDVGLRYQLAFMYEQAQFAPLAKREYRHVLLLDPANASASAGLVRLRLYPDL